LALPFHNRHERQNVVPRPFSEGEICPLNWGSEKSTVQLEFSFELELE